MNDQSNFEKLKEVLAAFSSGLTLKKDNPDYYYLNTNRLVKNKEMFFGAVQIRKSYVAYHLYPVYTNPELLVGLSEDLKKRMQGKSCFNFKKEITDEQLEGIRELTEKSFETFQNAGYLEI